jgi:hypothetical protein
MWEYQQLRDKYDHEKVKIIIGTKTENDEMGNVAHM